ncbi:MAG: hypothetical protein EAZ92_13205 [Candidatus Kapaibacterium sp.]|nr:MAG: hypothetical protein EAZ92_13205 [Candidatus Kapabacteria bacterium]
METIFNIFLAVHVAGGAVSLLSGAAAMIAAKGKRVHRQAGSVYYWAMAAVCASALVLSVLHPKQFLFYVAIFSFYLCFTGKRILRMKSLGTKATMQDWCGLGLAGVAGIAMLVRGGMSLARGVSFGWVSVVFGALCLGLSLLDAQRFRTAPTERMHWFFTHLTRMIGGYIATFTAFCVVNVHFLPALAVWLLPTAIGTVGIAGWTAHYRRKFRAVAR